MKNFFLLCILLCIPNFFVFSFSYKINSVTYNITGKTKKSAIRRMVPIDTSRIFKTEDEFAAYLRDVNIQMNNTRTFQTVSYDYRTHPADENAGEDANALYLADLTWTLLDTKHLIIAPYPKYNSNSGFEGKVKFKDTNFLGTMSILTSDLTFALPEKTDDKEMKQLAGDAGIAFGFNFEYNFPFKIKKFDVVWLNNYEFSYTIGHSMPEWSAKTGLQFNFPLNKAMKFVFTLTQGSFGTIEYKQFNDAFYFSEEGNIALPAEIAQIEHWGPVVYAPFIDILYNWDFNGINSANKKLLGPAFAFGHTLSTERINWKHNFRTGASFSIMQTFTYNFRKKELAPKFSSEIMLFKGFKYAGFASRFYYFVGKNTTENIGPRLRGIKDEQHFTPAYRTAEKACETDSALVINFDVPIHIFSTHFTKNKFLKKMNFEIQMAPFIDIALYNNYAKKSLFWLKDGFYAAGLEIIMNLESWKAIQVRGSVGVDIGRLLFKKFLNTDWRADISKYEISFGIGLHY